VWEQRRAAANDRTAEQQRRVSAIQRKMDKLDEALLVGELDVEGILAFAERILPRASDLWVQASLDYKQRLQQLFFPERLAFDGNRFNRTAVTAPLFRYLAASECADGKVVSRIVVSWNHIGQWLRWVEALRYAA
jgi:hypothetical protein